MWLSILIEYIGFDPARQIQKIVAAVGNAPKS